jgi:protein involved in polysaccharide export with SLBB domain
LFCIVFSFFTFSVLAQVTGQSSGNAVSGLNMTEITMLARSSADYRVTAGDVYTLTYTAGTTPVNYMIVVDPSYRIRASNLGVVNGAGKTFIQLKNEVETIVTNNYPLSGVQLVITQPAIFKVHVKGEVPVAGEVSVWALSRLSSLLSNLITTDLPTSYFQRSNSQMPNSQTTNSTTSNSVSSNPARSNSITSNPQTPDSSALDLFNSTLISLRDVSVRSSNGQTRVYDLFKARRLGDLSQDPYLRPGDEITFNRANRVITVGGQIMRPGTYQLMDGENVKELIEFYGSGFTPIADKTRIELVRIVNSVDIAGDKIFLTERDIIGNYTLDNLDEITIPIISQLQPVMFIEGAVIDELLGIRLSSTSSSSTSTSNIATSNRLIVQFNKGETYASLVRRNIMWFTTVSDTSNAYIQRNEERIFINLNPMLYDANYRGAVLVQENDVLVIPFRQYFVTVAGAVMLPGRYPYIPDRDWEYYIALAGGFVPERNARESVTIVDINGRTMKKTDAILPETVITAKTNHALYYWNQYMPVVTTILSLIATIFTIQAATR